MKPCLCGYRKGLYETCGKKIKMSLNITWATTKKTPANQHPVPPPPPPKRWRARLPRARNLQYRAQTSPVFQDARNCHTKSHSSTQWLPSDERHEPENPVKERRKKVEPSKYRRARMRPGVPGIDWCCPHVAAPNPVSGQCFSLETLFPLPRRNGGGGLQTN